MSTLDQWLAPYISESGDCDIRDICDISIQHIGTPGESVLQRVATSLRQAATSPRPSQMSQPCRNPLATSNPLGSLRKVPNVAIVADVVAAVHIGWQAK